VTCLNDVEEPLVKERIIKMNKDIEPGVKEFKW
jgi:dynein heavy chain